MRIWMDLVDGHALVTSLLGSEMSCCSVMAVIALLLCALHASMEVRSFTLKTTLNACASLVSDRVGQTCPGNIPGISLGSSVCCSTSCGACGGSECSSRPGGKSSCCSSGIKSSGQYCSDTGKAPCIL